MSKINTEKLSNIISYLCEELDAENIISSELIIHMNDNNFKKMDEDLFYKLKKDEKFIPSDNEIKISCSNLNIIIKKDDN